MQTHEYDLTGLMCPVPIIKSHRKMSDLASGDVLVVTTTDPVARHDFRDYCRSTGHKLLKVDRFPTHMRFHIKKR